MSSSARSEAASILHESLTEAREEAERYRQKALEEAHSAMDALFENRTSAIDAVIEKLIMVLTTPAYEKKQA